MALLWHRPHAAPPPGHAAPAPASELDRLRNTARERDEDRRIALLALGAMKPGSGPKALAEAILDACVLPFGLATFYLALADHAQDRLEFPLYFEGGKARRVHPFTLSAFPGLTTRMLTRQGPLYLPTKEAAGEAGASYTEAERLTGLIPETWYGLPLGAGPGWPERPFGVLSFQSFPADAFSPSRRAVMDILGAALALALKADPARKPAFG